jgi:hypothetical protein
VAPSEYGVGTRQLDTAATLVHVPNFLSESEVQTLRAIGDTTAAMHKVGAYQSVELRRPWEQNADATAKAIEARIGKLTGIPPHTSDSPLRMSVTRADATASGDLQVQNLHHDLQNAPARVATVLMYLSDDANDGLGGGATLFPCLDLPDAAAPRSRERERLCVALDAGFARGELFLSPPGGIYSSKPCFDPQAASLASGLCASSGSNDAVAVTPRRGDALLFWSASPTNGSVLRHMWHGGCRVARGEKWTLQQFKEQRRPT